MAMASLPGHLTVQVDSTTILYVPATQFMIYPFHWDGHTAALPGSAITISWVLGLLGEMSCYISGYDLTNP
jgi:hypothetical protein